MTNRKYPKQVLLHVYDLSPLNFFLHLFGLGVYHSGIEIYGREYTFAGGAGIFDTKPKDVIESEGIPLRETIVLGETMKDRQELDDILYSLKRYFNGNDYNLITKNCNTFSDALCVKLMGKQIPSHVNRLASIGYLFEPIITKIVNFIQGQYMRLDTPNANSSFIPFGGTGHKLN